MAIDSLVRDLRYTFRSLRRNAGFATFAILIAGLGIGASSTVFSVVNTLLLRPLPFEDPGRLVWIANRDTSGLSGQTTQVGHMLDLRERTQSLSALAGYFALYGLISYSVNQRTQEIGIRMALGASARDVQTRIIVQTLWLAAIGMTIGVAASWALARSLSGLLFGVTATDPATFLGMLLVLTMVATAAGYLPARRASRIDPLVALRAD